MGFILYCCWLVQPGLFLCPVWLGCTRPSQTDPKSHKMCVRVWACVQVWDKDLCVHMCDRIAAASQNSLRKMSNNWQIFARLLTLLVKFDLLLFSLMRADIIKWGTLAKIRSRWELERKRGWRPQIGQTHTPLRERRLWEIRAWTSYVLLMHKWMSIICTRLCFVTHSVASAPKWVGIGRLPPISHYQLTSSLPHSSPLTSLITRCVGHSYSSSPSSYSPLWLLAHH